MNFSELQGRITNSENLHTEFKECPVHPDDLAASLVALAPGDDAYVKMGINHSHGKLLS